jgi:hypothetical protein
MLYCKTISGPRLVTSYGGSDNLIIDLGVQRAQDALFYFDMIVFCWFAPTSADISFASPDKFFAVNAGANYRFMLNLDSRFLGVRPAVVAPWTVKVSLS